MNKDFCVYCGKLEVLPYMNPEGMFCSKCNDYKNTCEDFGM